MGPLTDPVARRPQERRLFGHCLLSARREGRRGLGVEGPQEDEAGVELSLSLY